MMEVNFLWPSLWTSQPKNCLFFYVCLLHHLMEMILVDRSIWGMSLWKTVLKWYSLSSGARGEAFLCFTRYLYVSNSCIIWCMLSITKIMRRINISCPDVRLKRNPQHLPERFIWMWSKRMLGFISCSQKI